VENLQLRLTFPDKPLIKTYDALWESCRSIAPLRLLFLEIFKLYSRKSSFTSLKLAKRNENGPERRRRCAASRARPRPPRHASLPPIPGIRTLESVAVDPALWFLRPFPRRESRLRAPMRRSRHAPGRGSRKPCDARASAQCIVRCIKRERGCVGARSPRPSLRARRPVRCYRATTGVAVLFGRHRSPKQGQAELVPPLVFRHHVRAHPLPRPPRPSQVTAGPSQDAPSPACGVPQRTRRSSPPPAISTPSGHVSTPSKPQNEIGVSPLSIPTTSPVHPGDELAGFWIFPPAGAPGDYIASSLFFPGRFS
jgi:hypothetical protein